MVAFVEEEENFNETVQSVNMENVEISNAINFLDKKPKINSSGSFTDEEVEC